MLLENDCTGGQISWAGSTLVLSNLFLYLNIRPASLERYMSQVCNGPICPAAVHKASCI